MSVVLMYHDIVTKDDKTSGFQNNSAFQYKVEETAFEEQVKALQGRDVSFTFDDGGVSFYTKAAPILERYGFKGIFFISTKFVGTPGFLSAEQVKELAQNGHIIGSHSHTHPSNIAALTQEEIMNEWKESARVLKCILGVSVETASIPNGYDSKKVKEYARKAGFSRLYTSVPSKRTRYKYGQEIVGRFVIHKDTSLEDVIRIVTSPSFRIKLSVRYNFLEGVKWILGSKYDRMKKRLFHNIQIISKLNGGGGESNSSSST